MSQAETKKQGTISRERKKRMPEPERGKLAFDLIDEAKRSLSANHAFLEAREAQFPGVRFPVNEPLPTNGVPVVWREGEDRFELVHRQNEPENRLRDRSKYLHVRRLTDGVNGYSSVTLDSHFEQITKTPTFKHGMVVVSIDDFEAVDGHQHTHAMWHDSKEAEKNIRKEFPSVFPSH